MAKNSSLIGRIATAIKTLPAVMAERAPVPAGEKSYSFSFPSIPASWPANFWQMGMSAPNNTDNVTVFSSVSLYSDTIVPLPIRHYKLNDDGSQSIMPNSEANKRFHRPNHFQPWPDMIRGIINHLLFTGNAYVVREPGSGYLYLMDSRAVSPMIAETGDVFYSVGGLGLSLTPAISEDSTFIPARDVAHFRLYSPGNPLVGVSPIAYAAASIASQNAIAANTAAFFTNRSRPSGVLSTDLPLSLEQTRQLRTAWDEQAAHLNSGKMPILSSGLKFIPISQTAEDAELVAAYKMNSDDIAKAFRIPPLLLGNADGASYSSTSTILNFWLNSGLGSLLTSIEATFSMFFNIPDTQRIKFDRTELILGGFQERIEALGLGITRGVYAPNEVRAILNLPPVEGGEEPRVQQQMVPLSFNPSTDSVNPFTSESPITEDEVKSLLGTNDELDTLFLN